MIEEETRAERVNRLNKLAAWLRQFSEQYGEASEPFLSLRLAADVLVAQSEDYADLRSDMDAMVDRFLAWPLPESVCSDLCVTVRGQRDRIGTQLLTADEARQMIEHVLVASTSQGEKA